MSFSNTFTPQSRTIPEYDVDFLAQLLLLKLVFDWVTVSLHTETVSIDAIIHAIPIFVFIGLWMTINYIINFEGSDAVMLFNYTTYET